MKTSRWFQAKDLLNDAVFEAMSASNGKAGWGRMGQDGAGWGRMGQDGVFGMVPGACRT